MWSAALPQIGSFFPELKPSSEANHIVVHRIEKKKNKRCIATE